MSFGAAAVEVSAGIAVTTAPRMKGGEGEADSTELRKRGNSAWHAIDHAAATPAKRCGLEATERTRRGGKRTRGLFVKRQSIRVTYFLSFHSLSDWEI